MVRLSTDCAVNVSRRPTLEKIAHDGSIGRGRFKKLFNMFYGHGAGNGSFLVLHRSIRSIVHAVILYL